MVDVYYVLVAVTGLASAALCLVAGLRRRLPSNLTILSVFAVELSLLVYLVSAIVRAVLGQGPAGPGWEFWSYMVTVLLIPVAAAFWAMLEKTHWSNVVLAVGGVVAFVMTARMNQIWYGIGDQTVASLATAGLLAWDPSCTVPGALT